MDEMRLMSVMAAWLSQIMPSGGPMTGIIPAPRFLASAAVSLHLPPSARTTMTTFSTQTRLAVRTLVIAAGLLTLSASVFGQATQPATAPQALPDAVTLIEESNKAMGGKKAFDAIESSMIKATMTSPMGELKMEMHSMKPGRFFLKQSVPGMGDMTTGSDGTTGWTSNPMSGEFQLLDSEQTKQIQKQSNLFRNSMHMLDDFVGHKTVDRLKFNDMDCYQVSMKDKDEVEQFAYFSVEDKLVQGFDMTQMGPRGPIKSSIMLGDWKENGDLRVFNKMTITSQGQTVPFVFDEVQFNQADEKVFELPEKVKELRDKKPATPAAPATRPAAPSGGGK
jgi:hypothetical protein